MLGIYISAIRYKVLNQSKIFLFDGTRQVRYAGHIHRRLLGGVWRMQRMGERLGE